MNYWYYKYNDINYCIKANTKAEAYDLLAKYKICMSSTITCITHIVAEGAKSMCLDCGLSFNDNGIWQPITRR